MSKRDAASAAKTSGATGDPAAFAAPNASIPQHEPGGRHADGFEAATGTPVPPVVPLAPVPHRTAAAHGASAAWLALIVLCVAWEAWLAPLRPGGSLLVLKALPLLLAMPGVWRHRLYTLQWASMLILLYFTEGVVRGWSEAGLSGRLGWLETALAVVFFVCALVYVAPFKRAAKHAARQQAKQAAEQAARRAAEDAAAPPL